MLKLWMAVWRSIFLPLEKGEDAYGSNHFGSDHGVPDSGCLKTEINRPSDQTLAVYLIELIH